MKKTLKKRAFVSAIAMLLVSAIVLTSATFAWFSMAKQATVEQMNLSVTSPEGIQISANATAWTTKLTQAQLAGEYGVTQDYDRYTAYAGNKNMFPSVLVPVSCSFKNWSSGLPRFNKVTMQGDGSAVVSAPLTQSRDNADADGFIAFDVFLKVAADTTVYWNNTTIADNSDADSDAVLGSRVGLVYMGNTTDKTAAAALAANTTVQIYEPEATTRSADATTNGAVSGVLTTQPVQSGSSTTVAAASMTEFYTVNTSLQTPYTATGTTLFTSKSTSMAISLKSGINKIRCYVLLEGQDVDCESSIAGGSIDFNLAFSIN